jgi:HEPN superfamily RiboL-PSP-like protein
MEYNIKNTTVLERVNTCYNELEKIRYIIEGFGKMSPPVPYLTRYSIIKACGTIEFGFKSIIADAQSSSHTLQVKNFIDIKFRNSSMNPNINNIHRSLKSFDDNWNRTFKELLKKQPNKSKILSSLESLNNARNTFAHGGTPSASFSSVVGYFNDSIIILQLLEKSIQAKEKQYEY